MVQGLDYSAAAIPGAAIRAAGYDFVLRYVDAPGTVNPKLITPAEYADLRAHGVDVYLVFEHQITDALDGYDAGATNAQRALAGAHTLGYHGVIFMAVDDHIAPAQMPAVREYFAGAVSVLGWDRTGVYGFPETVAAVPAIAYWQCGSQPSPDSWANVWQRNDGTVAVSGVECDVNELLIPIPAPHGSEDSVALIEFPATPPPSDLPDGTRWQDTHPSNWPMSGEQKTALVAAGPNTWRGLGSLSSLSCGWAYGLSASGDALDQLHPTPQDGPDAAGKLKPSGWIEYVRVFWFADGPGHGDWRHTDLWGKVPLIGNRSLPSVPLPPFCTLLVACYTAPGGLHLGVEYQH